MLGGSLGIVTEEVCAPPLVVAGSQTASHSMHSGTTFAILVAGGAHDLAHP